MRLLPVFFLLLISSLTFGQDTVGELTVRVENLKQKEGRVMVGLFDDKDQFLKEATVGEHKDVDESVVILTFSDLPSGKYAVSLYHDLNANGQLDANWFGIPKEPYAFSNNVKGLFGPPAFEDCLIEVGTGHKEITISL